MSSLSSRGQRSLPVQEARQVTNWYRRSSNFVHVNHIAGLNSGGGGGGGGEGGGAIFDNRSVHGIFSFSFTP